jgi:hypothetical protein
LSPHKTIVAVRFSLPPIEEWWNSEIDCANKRSPLMSKRARTLEPGMQFSVKPRLFFLLKGESL